MSKETLIEGNGGISTEFGPAPVKGIDGVSVINPGGSGSIGVEGTAI